MDTCDVLIVGGGPAGSSCAWKLRQAGLDVIVMDRASVSARQGLRRVDYAAVVVGRSGLDIDDYRRERTFQPITGFRTGLDRRRPGNRNRLRPSRQLRNPPLRVRSLPAAAIDGAPDAWHARSRAFARGQARWIVNDTIAAPMLVGAGGHFCPVARWLNRFERGRRRRAAGRARRKPSSPLTRRDAASLTSAPDMPELYFCRDFKGYGWCFRKAGLSQHRLRPCGSSRAAARDAPSSSDFLEPPEEKYRAIASWRWRGHAYLLSEPPRPARRRCRRVAGRRCSRPRLSTERRGHSAGDRIRTAGGGDDSRSGRRLHATPD